MTARTTLTMALCSALGISPVQAFDVPEDAMAQMNRVLYGTIVDDLMVGDKMRIWPWSLCVNDGKLMLSGSEHAADKSDYSAQVIAEMVSGSKIKITISTSHIDKPTRDKMVLNLDSCEFWPSSQLYPVESVNGVTSLEDYLNSVFVTGLPMSKE